MAERDKGWNLNSALILCGGVGGVVTAAFYFAPLETLPGDVRNLGDKLGKVEQTQAVQTEAIKTLAEVTKENRELRRDTDKNTAEIEGVKRRLERLEARP